VKYLALFVHLIHVVIQSGTALTFTIVHCAMQVMQDY